MSLTHAHADGAEISAAIELIMEAIPQVSQPAGLAACLIVAYALVNGEFPQNHEQSRTVIAEGCTFLASLGTSETKH